VNCPLPRGDRGNRTAVEGWTYGCPGLVPGTVGLAHGITNDSKHAVRHAACKNGSLYARAELTTGVGWTEHPVALPGACVSRSGWRLSHRSRNRQALQAHVRGAMKTERVDPSPGALGHPAVFSIEGAQKHLAGCW